MTDAGLDPALLTTACDLNILFARPCANWLLAELATHMNKILILGSVWTDYVCIIINSIIDKIMKINIIILIHYYLDYVSYLDYLDYVNYLDYFHDY